jgi:hypothetical protein
MEDRKEDEHVEPGQNGRVAVLSRHRQVPAGEAQILSIAPLSPHVEPRTWTERQYGEDGKPRDVKIPVVSLEGIDLARYNTGREAYTLGN